MPLSCLGSQITVFFPIGIIYGGDHVLIRKDLEFVPIETAPYRQQTLVNKTIDSLGYQGVVECLSGCGRPIYNVQAFKKVPRLCIGFDREHHTNPIGAPRVRDGLDMPPQAAPLSARIRAGFIDAAPGTNMMGTQRVSGLRQFGRIDMQINATGCTFAATAPGNQGAKNRILVSRIRWIGRSGIFHQVFPKRNWRE